MGLIAVKIEESQWEELQRAREVLAESQKNVTRLERKIEQEMTSKQVHAASLQTDISTVKFESITGNGYALMSLHRRGEA